MTLRSSKQYEPPSAEEFERDVLGVRSEPHAGRIALTANLVAANAATFKRAALDAIDAAGVLDLVVDLAHCPYVDGSGCGVLVSAANAAKRAGKSFAVINANEDLRKLFDLTQLSQLFEVRA